MIFGCVCVHGWYYMHTSIHTCIHTCIGLHAYIHAYIHTYIHAYILLRSSLFGITVEPLLRGHPLWKGHFSGAKEVASQEGFHCTCLGSFRYLTLACKHLW